MFPVLPFSISKFTFHWTPTSQKHTALSLFSSYKRLHSDKVVRFVALVRCNRDLEPFPGLSIEKRVKAVDAVEIHTNHFIFFIFFERGIIRIEAILGTIDPLYSFQLLNSCKILFAPITRIHRYNRLVTRIRTWLVDRHDAN